MYWLGTLCLLLSVCGLALSVSVKRLGPPPSTPLTIQMNGYSPTQNDEYVCTSSKRVEPGYILSYEPTANADRVHHMLLYGCEEPVHREATWSGGGTCTGGAKILFAWARNAPGLQMPPDVGLAIGHNGDNINYLVLQVHYATPFNGDVADYTGVTMQVTAERPRNLAAVYIFIGGDAIPQHLPAFFVNMSCPYGGETKIHPFAFRTHTHMMGRAVSAFYKHDEQWTMIGKRNPQWPQGFDSCRTCYDVGSFRERCGDSAKTKGLLNFGFYYFYNSPKSISFPSPGLVSHMFEKINRTLTISKGDVMAATCRFDSSNMDHLVRMGGMGKDEMCNFYMMFYFDADSPDPFPYGGMCGGVHDRTVFREYPSEGMSLLPSKPELEEHAHQSAITFGVVDRNQWTTIGDVKLGQVSGLARDQNGNLVIFHRGPRVWGGDTFDYSHKLNDQTAIDADVVLVIDPSVDPPKLLSKWGRQQFYLPHGAFVDKSGAFYLTDVGSHQVYKYTSGREGMKLAFALGEKFVPGSDEKHLCQPSGVAVAPDGSIFVSDGYCNSRVVKYSADGQFQFAFGERSAGAGPAPLGTFMLPHDIIIDEARKLIRVADRQNGRVQTFQMDGVPVGEVRPPSGVKTMYSMDVAGDTIYLLPGERPVSAQPEPIRAFAASVETNLISYSWSPKTRVLERPHILRTSADGRFIYVGEISGDGGIVWKLEVTREWGKVTMVHHDDSSPAVIKGGGAAQTGTLGNKPIEANDQTANSGATNSASPSAPSSSTSTSSMGRLTIFIAAVSVPLCITLAVCLFLRCRKTGGRFSDSFYKGKPFLDRNGFKPLKTEDLDALDDLTTDESDQEDTLYASKPKPPLKA